jgi:murein DD-endopeptidase MepM/ murein hydrolase activator NlpD
MAVVSALLMGAGATAFGVAPYLPDAEDIPVQVLEEVVRAQPIDPQIQSLRGHGYALFRSDSLLSSDTADSLMRRLGVSDVGAVNYLRADSQSRQIWGRSGRQATAVVNDQHQLQQLVVRWAPEDSNTFTRLVINRVHAGFSTRVETAPLKTGVTIGTGVIRTSLFAATDESRIPDAVAMQLVRLFEGDVDFHRGMRKGDRFSLQYETLEADGEILRTGRVLSAQLTNAGTTHTAMWFDLGGGKGDYYSFDGQSRKRTYLASPLEFSRVSSGFSMRLHPIHKVWKRHLGVDYAAAPGTPIRSVGDGVVVNAGWNNAGYGNVVEVRHRNGSHTTLYAHMSRIAVRKGQAINQGTVVGHVGSTGWSTGPHLHFEFRVNGVHQDPLRLVKAKEIIPLPVAAKPAFDKLVRQAKTDLEQVASLVPTRAQ